MRQTSFMSRGQSLLHILESVICGVLDASPAGPAKAGRWDRTCILSCVRRGPPAAEMAYIKRAAWRRCRDPAPSGRRCCSIHWLSRIASGQGDCSPLPMMKLWCTVDWQGCFAFEQGVCSWWHELLHLDERFDSLRRAGGSLIVARDAAPGRDGPGLGQGPRGQWQPSRRQQLRRSGSGWLRPGG